MRENKTLHYYMKWALMLTFMWVCQFANAQDFVKGRVNASNFLSFNR